MALALKRFIDVAVAATLLALSAPLLAVVLLVVRWRLGRPAVFRQVRPGYRGRPFLLYKVRTMRDALGPDDRSLPDAERLTPLGRFLRSTSLDELPQLWNVLRGDLSLVGPRPLLTHYLPLYTPDQARRHDVRPGVTGWAQVNGRNAIGWDEKFRLDLWYVDHWSPWLDVKIIVLTALKVLWRSGVTRVGHATTEEFTGGGVSSEA